MLDRKFILQKCIGQGGSSRVYLSEHPESQGKYAIKVIRKDKGINQKKGAFLLHQEHERMVKLQAHPNILKSYGAFWEGELDTELGLTTIQYSVLELAENGSFHQLIRKVGGLGETLAKFPFMQMCCAVQYIHSQGIAHMDLKLDNILIDKYFNCKIADLGVSLDVSETNGMTDSKRGTACYMSPEIKYLLPTETYDAYKSDIYSLGVWLYVLLFGELPLKQDNEDSTNYNSDTLLTITGLKFSIDCRKKWSQLPMELQDLLSWMLSMDPDERPSLQEILGSSWLKEAYFEDMPFYFYEKIQKKNFDMNEDTWADNQEKLWLEGEFDTYPF